MINPKEGKNGEQRETENEKEDNRYIYSHISLIILNTNELNAMVRW